jgi:hypothetical protein
MKSLTIRSRLWFAIGFIVLSLAAIGAANRYFQQAAGALEEMETDLQALHSRLLELRRAEKNFLAHRGEAHVDAFRSTFSAYRDQFDRLRAAMERRGMATEALEALHARISSYRDDFIAVVNKQREIGLGPDQGHYGALGEAAQRLEKVVEGHPGLMVALLELRRHEKDFMLQREPRHANRFRSALAPFRNQFFLADIANETRGQAQKALAKYSRRFDELVKLEREIGLNRDQGILGRMTGSVDAAETAFEQARNRIGTVLAAQHERQRWLYLGILFSVMTVAVLLLLFINRGVSRSFAEIMGISRDLGTGHWDRRIPVDRGGEVGVVMRALADMRDELRRKTAELDRDNRIKSRHTELAGLLRGRKSRDELAADVIRYLTPALGCHLGAFLIPRAGVLECAAGYALPHRPAALAPGEGLAGQAAREGKVRLVRDLPDDFLPVASGTGAARPGYLWLVPLLWNGELHGVIELGGWGEPDGGNADFLESAAESIAIALHAAGAQDEMERALAEAREQAEALAQRKAAMEQANAELEDKSRRLESSEEQLRAHEEELRVTNEELESQTRALQRRNHELEQLLDARGESDQSLRRLG